ncbi:hypothetical protein SRHO_G00222370 [Serrasalmus rhombeus]
MADVTSCVGEYRLCCQPGVSLMKIGIQTARKRTAVYRVELTGTFKCSNAEDKISFMLAHFNMVPVGISNYSRRSACNCLGANGRQTIVLNEVKARGSELDFIKS